MSETFFIKHTSFDDFSNDINDRESSSFIIGPGELNGPGGRDPRASDLELYGFGALKWGEGVNQNLFRILQSFSCPQKVSGDFLAGTDDPYDGTQGTSEENPYAFVPGTGSFNPSINQVTPKDEYDLGIGNGITFAVLGQLWFNTTDEEVYMYGTSAWRLITATASSGGSGALNAHIADDTLHLTTLQNIFLDGLNLPALTPAEVNTLNGISLSLGGGTVQGQLDLMVEKAGDTMTGDLTIKKPNPTLILELFSPFETASLRFNDFNGDKTFEIEQFNGTTVNFKLNNGSDFFSVKGDGNVSVTATLPATINDLTRKDYVDNNFITTAGVDFRNETSSNNSRLVIRNSTTDLVSSSSTINGGIQLEQTNISSTYDAFLQFKSPSGSVNLGRESSGGNLVVGGGTKYPGAQYTIWHSGNDGPGSGLNADYLDNLSSTSFLRTGQGYQQSDIFSTPSLRYSSRLYAGNRSVTVNVSYGTRPSWAINALVLFNFTFFSGNTLDMRWCYLNYGGRILVSAGSDDNDQGYVSAPMGTNEMYLPYWATSFNFSSNFGGIVLGGANARLNIYLAGWHS